MRFNKNHIAGLVAITIILFSCKKKETLFTSLSSSETNIAFVNKLENKKMFNILYYLYFYNGGGVSTGDINNDGLPDIYFTANSKGNNKLYLNKGDFKFEDITEKAGVKGVSDWCTGSAMADVNGDGFLDIYVSTVSNKYNLTGHNELYINNGNGTFTEKSAAYGLNTSCFTTQSAFFDYDKDGDLDCYILNQSHHPHANIVDTSNRRNYDTLSGDRLYRNDLATSGRFTEVSKEAGIFQSNLGYGLGLAIADINNDGWDDIYIGNDFHENDYYYINQKNGSFSEEGAKHFGHYSRFSMGNDVADYNNDGQLDVVTVDMLPPNEKVLKTYGSDENPDTYKVKLEIRGYQYQYSKNCLQRNNGNGENFSELALVNGIAATDWSWCPLFADFDNDGTKDLFISSGIVKRPVDMDYVHFVSDLQVRKGMNQTDKYDDEAINAMPDGSSHPFFFSGNTSTGFKDVSDEWGTGKMKGYFNGAAYADLDNDGDLDLVTNNLNAKATVLKNNTAAKNYISLSFRGDSANTFGIGCKAFVFQKNRMQYQQLMSTRGFESSSDLRLHFGLGADSLIDSILVVWPNQQYQLIKNAKGNKQVVINKNEAADMYVQENFFPPVKKDFENVTGLTAINWKHIENDFNDFNVQYLIPHKESTRGPKTAVADVNGDGLDDFYVCGALGQPGTLMIQRPNGTFAQQDKELFEKDMGMEGVDAIFFDANGDKKPDLWVVAGGNQSPLHAEMLTDKLYINNGDGHFTRKLKFMSQQMESKSCVAVADVDHDGDMDAFIGTLSTPTIYGKAQSSYILINDGAANFTIANDKNTFFHNMGMVTSAAFADINGDGWQDLVVAGEFMNVKTYFNNKGVFTNKEIPASSGIWQTVSIADVNNDGFADILAGNWGHNNKLWSGKNGPVKLYVNDFDNNGTTEQVLCYTVDGKEYTFLAKDELERPLPVLKKAYLTYGEIAGKTVQYMFYDLFRDYTEYKAETLSSTCFINDGKGNFTAVKLPDELQLAPVFSFQSMPGNTAWMAGGNFYGVIPYEGRYDALRPTAFSFNKTTNAFQTQGAITELTGEVRDMKWISTGGNGKMLVVARNNESLLFYKQTNENNTK